MDELEMQNQPLEAVPDENREPAFEAMQDENSESAQPEQIPAEEPKQEYPEMILPTFGQSPDYRPAYAVAAAPIKSAPQPKKSKKPKKKKGISVLGVIALCLVCALIGGLAGGIIARSSQKQPDTTKTDELLARIESLEKAQLNEKAQQTYDAQPAVSTTEVYEQNVNSVVSITTGTTTTNVFGQSSGIASSGSGFIVRSDGYVVTNYHVVDGGQTLAVTLRDGTEYEAQVVGYDSGLDVAVLKIEAQDLQAVTIGDSDLLHVGDQVAAIGNPLGELTLSMTVGYISALDREINTDGIPVNMLQTDVAINSGNSGGPLFDMKGRVIGITTAKYSGSTSSGASIEGIGFALPINDVMRIVDDLLELGYISGRAYLGITAMDMDAQTASVYSLPVGAYVNSVVDGFCAQKAGLQKGDIILSLGDYEIGSYADLSRALREFSPGEETTMGIYRAGAGLTLTVVFDERPSDEILNGQTQSEAQTPSQEQEAVPENPAEDNAQQYGFSEDDMEQWFRYFFGG